MAELSDPRDSAHVSSSPAAPERSMSSVELTPEAGEGRARWTNPIEFTITCIGYAVGLGNFWRFPYYCYQYGGGAFLVPYTIVLFVIGMPLFLIELYVGQKHQVSAAHAWGNFHPAFGGVGLAGTMATFFVALYYNVIVGWALWFLFNSFASPLPWADTPNMTAANQTGRGALDFWEVATLHCRGELSSCSWLNVTDWAAVAESQPSLFETDGLVMPLVACLVLGWFLIWLCVCKGIESLGKVAWFTAIFPYFVLFILLVRGLTLEGASVGLEFYLSPSFDQLGRGEVWIAAASQIFYSTGIGWGTLVAFASYNDKSHNFVRDAWMVPLINCGTSFLAGLVVFSVLGFMAQRSGVTVAELQLQGSGLAFVAYPTALSQMPGGQFFSVLFFVMVLCLGIDSQFAMVETVLTALNDAHVMPMLSKPAKSAVVCAGMCLIGLVFVTRAGLHWLELFDSFACNVTLFVAGGLECVAVGWVYGTERFAADTLHMTKTRLPKPLLWNIKYVIPSLLFFLTFWTLVTSVGGGYPFPPAAVGLGWVLSSCALAPLLYLLIGRSVGPLVRVVLARLRAGGTGGPRLTAGKRMPREVTPGVTSAAAEGGSDDVPAAVMERTLPSPTPARTQREDLASPTVGTQAIRRKVDEMEHV